MRDKGQPQRRLPCVVRHGIAHQRNAKLLRNLLHNCRLANARRAKQKNGPLAHNRNAVLPIFVLFEIQLYRIFDMLLRLLDIHVFSPPFSSNSSAGSTSLIAHDGMGGFS